MIVICLKSVEGASIFFVASSMSYEDGFAFTLVVCKTLFVPDMITPSKSSSRSIFLKIALER